MKIIISGDSFTYGQGCKDRIAFTDPVTGTSHRNFAGSDPPSKYCWASLLQNHYPDHQIINLARPGKDNMYISTSIIENVKDADIVYFLGTACNRLQIMDIYGNPIGIILGGLGGFEKYVHNESVTLFLKHLYLESYFLDISISSLLATYAHCIVKDISFVWSMPYYGITGRYSNDTFGVNEISKTESIVRTELLLKDNQLPPLFGYSFFKSSKQNQDKYISFDGHANEIGHEYYFNYEILPIFSKLIEEKQNKGY